MNASQPGEENQDRLPAHTLPSTPQLFATTRWTVVLEAGHGQIPQAEKALEELCATYWYPLYAYVRHQGHSREDAEDLVQGFFARFLQKNYLAGLQVEKGKFRAFLLASLKHYLANEWDRAARQKRGAGATHLSLDWQTADTRYHIEPVHHLSPDKLYDRAWTLTLLERVMTRLRQEHSTRPELFEQLKPFLMLGKGAIPYAQAAADLGITEGAARVAVHRVRRRYRELLREEVAQTLADASQIDAEMRSLLEAFSL